jgi:hypothetical protein
MNPTTKSILIVALVIISAIVTVTGVKYVEKQEGDQTPSDRGQ